MDLFILDKLVIAFIKSLIVNPVKQFAALTAIWLVVEVALPSKKKVSK